MAKIDLDSLSIEELAALREHATDKLFEKVAARRAKLEAEQEKAIRQARQEIGQCTLRQGRRIDLPIRSAVL